MTRRRESPTRRQAMAAGVSALALSSLATATASSQARDGDHGAFAAEAERMRRAAVAAGDQSYGAVLVADGRIAGWGPSRVIVERNPDAHAERVAIRDAQQRLGRTSLAGTTLYSTSRPCSLCEAAAAKAGVALMRWGRDAASSGKPSG